MCSIVTARSTATYLYNVSVLCSFIAELSQSSTLQVVFQSDVSTASSRLRSVTCIPKSWLGLRIFTCKAKPSSFSHFWSQFFFSRETEAFTLLYCFVVLFDLLFKKYIYISLSTCLSSGCWRDLADSSCLFPTNGERFPAEGKCPSHLSFVVFESQCNHVHTIFITLTRGPGRGAEH